MASFNVGVYVCIYTCLLFLGTCVCVCDVEAR